MFAWADVNTAHPDKKSIMMYVMCLFQSLPHSSEDVADVESPPPTPTAAAPHGATPNAEVRVHTYGMRSCAS